MPNSARYDDAFGIATERQRVRPDDEADGEIAEHRRQPRQSAEDDAGHGGQQIEQGQFERRDHRAKGRREGAKANPRIGRSYWTHSPSTVPASSTFDAGRALELARATLDIEARALDALKERQGDGFVAALAAMLACRGRVVVMGMGKSGHVGRKVAATLASTGTPALLRSSRRSEPRRSRHGDARRRRSRDLELGRERRAGRDRAGDQASRRHLHRHDRTRRQQPRPPRRHRHLERGRPGGMPAQPRADGEHDGADGARRRARGRAARRARLSRRGFRALASGRQPRPASS